METLLNQYFIHDIANLIIEEVCKKKERCKFDKVVKEVNKIEYECGRGKGIDRDPNYQGMTIITFIKNSGALTMMKYDTYLNEKYETVGVSELFLMKNNLSIEIYKLRGGTRFINLSMPESVYYQYFTHRRVRTTSRGYRVNDDFFRIKSSNIKVEDYYTYTQNCRYFRNAHVNNTMSYLDDTIKTLFMSEKWIL
jgi:hypothetical protein